MRVRREAHVAAVVVACAMGPGCGNGPTATHPAPPSRARATAPPPPSPPEAPPPSPPPTEEATKATPAPSVTRVELPAPVKRPASSACTLSAARWRGKAVPLRLEEGGPAFAQVSSGAADLSIPVGRVTSAVLDLDSSDTTLRGIVRTGAVEIHPAAAFVAGGFAVPTVRARLDLVDGHDGELTVGVDLGDDVKVVAGQARARRPCSDVGLAPERFDPRTALPPADATSAAMLLRTGAPIALSDQPGGAPVAHVTVERGFEIQAVLIERDKRQTRVAWEQNDAWLFGWVAPHDLRPAPSTTGYGTGSGTVGSGPGTRRTDTVVCGVDLPLVVEIGGVRATVGKLKKGRIFKRLGEGAALAPIEPYPSEVTFLPDAKLFAPADVLAGCKPKL